MKRGATTCIVIVLVLAACTPPVPTDAPNMVNPASAFCEEQGYESRIITSPDGSQRGICIFPDGTSCDEWAYFRGECEPGGVSHTPTASEAGSTDWLTYQNDDLGYSFQYPAGVEVSTDDDPLNSLSISGAGLGDEFWGIGHPGDREEYRPPEGADLLQWLTDHNLLGEKRMPDTEIAGTTAVHFRHDRTPQSYADDRYYFAHGNQFFVVMIGHASDVEDWDLNNRFLKSIQFVEE